MSVNLLGSWRGAATMSRTFVKRGMALGGIKVVELAGLAPAPFCGMVLADFGASVVRVDRPSAGKSQDTLSRGKRSIAIDLKQQSGQGLLKDIIVKSDVLIDPYRPGVLEKMNLGPDQLLELNPGLVIARITGYGQTGPMSGRAGHDLNYVATSGVLSMLGKQGSKPFPPVNLLADFAGGGLLTAMGICMALLERNKSGKGQVVDTSMTEGAAYLSSFLWRSRSPSLPMPIWFSDRGSNVLDGGVHFYQTYETSDGKYMTVAAIEPQFYDEFVTRIGKDPEEFPRLTDFEEAIAEVERIFLTKTQKEWTEIFEGSDACVTPVIDFEEVDQHEQHKEREAFISYDGTLAPNPSPKLSRTPASASIEEPDIGEHTLEILREYGLDGNVTGLLTSNVIQVNRAKL